MLKNTALNSIAFVLFRRRILQNRLRSYSLHAFVAISLWMFHRVYAAIFFPPAWLVYLVNVNALANGNQWDTLLHRFRGDWFLCHPIMSLSIGTLKANGTQYLNAPFLVGFANNRNIGFVYYILGEKGRVKSVQ